MYSLEQVDDENKRRQAAMGNISASNDPQQQVHDSNEQLIKGAEVLGAGRTLGLTDDEALETKAATLRREQRERRARRGVKVSDPAVRAEIRDIRAQDGALEQIRNQFANRRFDEADFVDAQGEAPEPVFNDRGGLEEINRPQDLDQNFSQDELAERGLLDSGGVDDPELVKQKGRYVLVKRKDGRRERKWAEGGKLFNSPDDVKFRRDDQLQRHFAGLRAGEFDGRAQRDADRAAGRAAVQADLRRREGRMTTDEQNEFIAQEARRRAPETVGTDRIAAIQSIQSELDQKRVDGVGRKLAAERINNERADAEAQQIAQERFVRGGGGDLADMNIGRIAEVRGLGKANDVGNIQVIQFDDPANFPTAVEARDPQGNVLGFLDPGQVPTDRRQLLVKELIGSPNQADTSTALNAPMPRAGGWALNVIDEMKKGNGDVGGFPQAEIGDIGREFIGRARNLNLDLGGLPDQINNLVELDEIADRIIGAQQAAGQPMFRFDAESGKNIAVSDPGIDEVLNLLRFGPNDRERLANAMFQGQMAGTVPRPGPDVQVIMGAEGLRADGGVPLALIKNEKVGRGKKAKAVKGELRKISAQAVMEALAAKGELYTEVPNDPKEFGRDAGKKVLLPNAIAAIQGADAGRVDAQKPIIGALGGGAEIPKAKFIRGNQRGLGEAALVEKFGAPGLIGAEVERRYIEDRNAREAAIGKPDAFAQNQRALDSQFARAGREAEAAFEKAEKFEIAKLMFEGAQKEGKFDLGGQIAGRPRVIEAAPAGRKLVVPSSSAINQNSDFNVDNLERVGKGVFRRREQPIQPAATPQSITPQPGASTGNQPTPAIDAGGGGMMGGNKPPSTSAMPNPPDNPMPGNLRQELNRISKPKWQVLEYMTAPDGARRSSADRRERRLVSEAIRRENRIRGGATALGAGSAAVLAGILGTRKQDEEEEQY